MEILEFQDKNPDDLSVLEEYVLHPDTRHTHHDSVLQKQQ